jgi:hypothetical protein
MKRRASAAIAIGAFAIPLLWASAGMAQDCVEAGVITRLQGRPQDLRIVRAGAPVDRVRVLEPLCVGDRISAVAPTWASLSLDGAKATAVRVDAAHPFVVPGRSSSNLAQTGWNLAVFKLSRDMKRRPWDVRLRGPGPELSFAIPSLNTSPQQLTAGRGSLLVRLDGGVGAYHVALTDAAGGDLGAVETRDSDVVLTLRKPLEPGDYQLTVRDTAGTSVKAAIRVVAGAAPVSPAEVGFADPEVNVALAAAELAQREPATWSLEAEQMIFNAPAGELDRLSIYELIEGYEGE